MKNKFIVAFLVVLVVGFVGIFVGTKMNTTEHRESDQQSGKVKGSTKSIKKEVTQSSEISSSSKNSSAANISGKKDNASQSSSSSKIDANLLQMSDFDNGYMNNEYVVKSIIYYGVMHGEERNNKMWGAFKEVIQNPSQYPTIEVHINSGGTGLYLLVY